MSFRSRKRLTVVLGAFVALASLVSLFPVHLRAQDDGDSRWAKHGRKYKPPPDTSHIEVTVLKGFNKKPIDGAHVIFNPTKDGKDEGNLELKTHPDGKAVIDVIPTGSTVTIQVLADGFATYAKDYQIDEATRNITIEMVRPRAQVSAYVDNNGKASQIQPGIQEPIRPKSSNSSSGSSNANSSGTNANASGSGSSSQSH